MDVARLGLEIDSKPVATANRELHALTGAAGQAAVAARQLAGASQMEAAGVNTATVAVRANTAAHHANNAAMKMAAMQRRNLLFQLNDIGVSLASGMNPLMVAVQQGSQIATIYEGGVVPALQATAAMAGRAAAAFWPIGLAIGAVVGVLAGLTYEINKTAEVQVGFFDVALAGWQLLSESIGALMAPVWTWFVDSMRWVWDQTAPVMKKIGNDIVSAFVAAYNVVTSGWQNLPTFMGALGKQAWNALLEGLSGDAITFTNPFTGEVNKLLSFDFTGFKAQLSPEEQGSWQSSVGNAFSQDWMGGGFGALSDRSQAIAMAKTEVEALGGAASAANDNVKKLADDGMTKAFDVAKGLQDAFQGVGKGIFDAFKKGGDVASSVLEMLMGKLEQFATSWLDNIVNNGLNSLFSSFGSFGIGSGMRGTSSITGSSGGFFPAFDGGGYTGSGSRSGGMDGKGGFLAMLHPNETVLDHTRGQAANQNAPTVVVRPETHIHPPQGYEPVSEESQGGMRQDVYFRKAVAGAISSQGPANSAVRNVGRLVRR